MKTIAIMTMVFVPATFFAALFSVPSLQWNSEGVVTGHFWIHWAFVIPATALVFAIWATITNRNWLKEKVRRGAEVIEQDVGDLV